MEMDELNLAVFEMINLKFVLVAKILKAENLHEESLRVSNMLSYQKIPFVSTTFSWATLGLASHIFDNSSVF